MEAQLRACVQQSLDDFMYSNAKFMCERLYAEFANETNLLLLANVYLRADQAYRAYHLLKDATWSLQRRLSPHGRYLLAQSCFKLNKYEEARGALKLDSHGQIPGGAAGFYLLGQVHSLIDQPSPATTAFKSALEHDPLMWSAYERLCQLGHNELAEEILRQASLETSPQEMQQNWQASELQPSNLQSHDFFRRSGNRLSFGNSQTPANTSLRQSFPAPSSQQARYPSALQNHFPHGENTPNLGSSSRFITPSPGVVPNVVAAAPKRNGHIGIRETPTPTPLQRGLGRKPNVGDDNPYKFFDDGKIRKVSGRLFAEPSTAISNSPNITTRRGSRLAASSSTPLAPVQQKAPGLPRLHLAHLREQPEQPSMHAAAGASVRGACSAEGQREVINLLKPIGEAYGLLCMYQCQEAITAFDELSVKQYKTAWVLCQVGRAYYEMVDFKSAASAFQKARECEPTRLEGMELYSTVLWHLKQEVELSHLAQEAIQLDRLDPRAWCIMGNCFSLQKDQNAALRFFQRAVQLDSTFVYAYTLAGHENLALEQFDKSITCFRNAMKMDPRHYHAWYGCGQIFYRQEKYEVAAYHFEGSLKINERSSILLCYMGMALAKLNRHEEACSMLRNAIYSDPQNPLARYELANVLVEANCFTDALQELEQLKDKAPKEPSIYFHMGQIYRQLNRTDLALLQFSQALDLKPSSSDINMIKAAIEKLQISNEFDDNEI